ncbi:M14 family zinc carboxypeptidase [Nonlabens sp. YIK11]|uniref:M14 family zinc carboxypeptidase n=1 Tax=Nonlabens sp. YIK11 TaxID=1453349 RepID=UPI0006DC0E55|nr:M14 family zinc carboxypeptidase [Nonlabens sp. YIK11]
MSSSIHKLPRYFTYEHFEKVFMEVIEKLPQDFYSFSYLGSSVENRSVFGLRLGHGDLKVLAWSQMHGNESTTTRAIVGLLENKEFFQLLDNISLYIIPVLNPDGANEWTRNNANNVDLNRDAQELSQPESLILKDAIDFFKPDLALNLHGQRTIYGVENSVLPCQLSFLTPSADPDKRITPSRLQSMKLINHIIADLKDLSKAAVGRYDDAFNINCWGDYCQSQDIPTILFEAGHAGEDYSRDHVVELIKESLMSVLKNVPMMKNIENENESVLEVYQSIPAVQKNYVDILLRNAPSINGARDIAIMYHEQVASGGLEFIPMIYAIDEDCILYGHRTIDLAKEENFQDDLVIEDDMVVTSQSLKISSFIK